MSLHNISPKSIFISACNKFLDLPSCLFSLEFLSCLFYVLIYSLFFPFSCHNNIRLKYNCEACCCVRFSGVCYLILGTITSIGLNILFSNILNPCHQACVLAHAASRRAALRRPGSDPRPVRMGFVVDKMALG